MLEEIYSKGFSVYLHSFGAIDSWLARNSVSLNGKQNFIHILTNADISDLAKLFEELRYPGVDLADAALDADDKTWYFRCVESLDDNSHLKTRNSSFKLLDFYCDCKTNTFIDPHGVYPVLKEIGNNINVQQVIIDELNLDADISQLKQRSQLKQHALMDAALILSKYFHPDNITIKEIKNIAACFFRYESFDITERQNKNDLVCDLNQEEQRVFLTELITSPNPGLGFELLKASGFLEMYWKELALLEKADHSKEFHPEGNAWDHTMETFRHRKTGSNRSVSQNRFAKQKKAYKQAVYAYDLRLSLGLLLHDSGKPIAISTGSKRYDGHAELGETQARRFLDRLGFNPSVTHDVCFLVRNHMLPAALPRLPLFRTEQIMSSPLFPLLMELYRCDESSSFKGLDSYYESAAAYQQFLRNKRNPYKSFITNR
ncbi:MAG: phosphohydrolase [Treponema sp.]|nr:phosphohydrolase [Treponema sp.]